MTTQHVGAQSWDGEAITPTALKRARKHAKTLREEYRAQRRKALDACAAARASGTRRDRLRAEDELAEVWASRLWLYKAIRDLANAEARPIVKGAHLSPAAREGLVLRGVWRR